jgi:hypothetical protein
VENRTFLCALNVACLFGVLSVAGTDFGYAGIANKWMPYFKATLYLYAGGGCTVVAVMGAISLYRRRRLYFDEWLYAFLLFAAITFPQIMLYAKSNIIDQYLIPGTLGCAFISIFTWRKLKQNDHFIDESFWRRISIILGIIMLIFFAFFFHPAGKEVFVDFAFRMQGGVLQQITSTSSLHYLLATISIIAATGLLCSLILLIYGCMKKRKKFAVQRVSQLYAAGLVFILLLDYGLAFASCKRYAMRGIATEKFIHTIIQGTKADDTILIAGSSYTDMEGVNAGLPVYLNKYNRRNLYICCPDSIPDKTIICAIAVFPGVEENFITSNPWFMASEFCRHEFQGNFVVYLRE